MHVCDFSSIDYLSDNKRRTNKYLNMCIFIFIFTGPFIAIGVLLGYFRDISLMNCFLASLLVTLLFSIDTLLIKKNPDALITTVVSLLGAELTILIMNEMHIGIYLTYFLVPLMSLLYCRRSIYLTTSFWGLWGMILGSYRIAPYRASLMTDMTANQWFWGYLGGYLIEYTGMFATGLMLSFITTAHYSDNQKQMTTIQKKDEDLTLLYEEEHSKYKVFSSLAEVYISIHLINLENDSVIPYVTTDKIEQYRPETGSANMQTFHAMSELSTPEYRNTICEFVNFSTLRPRLRNCKCISCEFIGRINGWCRASFIAVERDDDNEVTQVLYTVSNINDEKNREANLIEMSFTDELTEIGNRHAYVEAVQKINEAGIRPNFAIVAFDIDNLKEVNDAEGHCAGDELIQGAANIMAEIFGPYGSCFRMGGDEFAVTIEANKDLLEELCDRFEIECHNWRGIYSEELSVSLGYARAAEFDGCTTEFLFKEADERMYAQKLSNKK